MKGALAGPWREDLCRLRGMRPRWALRRVGYDRDRDDG